jgi:hypothetical protein
MFFQKFLTKFLNIVLEDVVLNYIFAKFKKKLWNVVDLSTFL